MKEEKVVQANDSREWMLDMRVIELENKVSHLTKEREALVQAIIAIVGR